MTVHLYVRSSFSLLDSTIRINDLVRRAKQYGYQALALTDHNVMHGAPVFLRACAREGIRPVFGLEADCMYHDEIVPFLLLAKDNIGFSALMKLSSIIASGTGYCTSEQLIESCRHCFLIVFTEGGWFESAIISEDRDEVTRRLSIMKEELPPFDVALSYMDAALWKARSGMIKRICSAMSVRTCALNRIYYLDEEDSESCRILRGIGQGRTIKDQSLPLITGRSFLNRQAMEQLYDSEDLARTDEIAAQC
ncbi:MAG: PHP domain-containing protein, partial [Erysipelotrichaceae bacterium]|nr:PHP domain-containing protein [Erysipelotrichaceae bacterium]